LRRVIVVVACVSLVVALQPCMAGAAPRLKWSVDVPGALQAVDTSPSGLTAVGGSRWAPRGREAMLVAVYGPGGGLRWEARWRPDGCSVYASAVALAAGDTTYVGGIRSCEKHGEIETWWFLRRYTRDGELMWRRGQPAAQHPKSWGSIDAIVARSGGVIVAGDDTGCCDVSGGQDGWIRAFDGHGRPLWTDPFEPPGIPAPTHDLVTDLAVSGGAIYAAGYVSMGTPHEPWRDQEAVVARLAPGGSLMWAHVTHDPGLPNDFDVARSVTIADGRPVAAMEVNAVTSAWTRFLGFGPRDGALRWSEKTNGWPMSLAGTVAGDLYLTSRSHGIYTLRQFGSHGGEVWSSGDLGGSLGEVSITGGWMSMVGAATGRARIWRYALG
jgi:hypothetical protein